MQLGSSGTHKSIITDLFKISQDTYSSSSRLEISKNVTFRTRVLRPTAFHVLLHFTHKAEKQQPCLKTLTHLSPFH